MSRAPGCALGQIVHALEEAESTQLVLARLAEAGAAEGTVVTARHQRAGRGRAGRGWWDEPGHSLLCSVLLRPDVPPARAPELSLVAGLAVAEALEPLGVAAGIKWPNDVLAGGRKVAGVLAQAAGAGDGRVRHVLLGIGVNVNQDGFPPPLAERAASLRLLSGRRHEPAAVLALVLDRLGARYGEWLHAGLAGLRGAWRARDVTPGTPVRTAAGDDGIALDVADDGALLVRLRDGRVTRVVSPAAGDGA